MEPASQLDYRPIMKLAMIWTLGLIGTILLTATPYLWFVNPNLLWFACPLLAIWAFWLMTLYLQWARKLGKK